MQKAGNKGSSFPHVFVILLSIIVLAMVASWFVPAGEYARVLDPKSKRTVIDPTSYHLVESVPEIGRAHV